MLISANVGLVFSPLWDARTTEQMMFVACTLRSVRDRREQEQVGLVLGYALDRQLMSPSDVGTVARTLSQAGAGDIARVS